MNLASAQDISHCQIEVEVTEDWHFVTAIRDGKPLATHGGWKCEHCGRIVGLTSHHDMHRARGQRDDDPSNLRALCSSCHSKIHGG